MTELKAYIDNNKVSMVHKEKAKKVLTYYQNNKHMMNYPDRLKKDQPMGSGVTEAACKILDDWAMTKLQGQHQQLLLDVLDDRYQKTSTIITSQLPVAAWYAQTPVRIRL
jgi:hypothetical protein